MPNIGDYVVQAAINFDSNGMAQMRELAQSARGLDTEVNALNKSLMYLARAQARTATVAAALTAAVAAQTKGLDANASAADRNASALDRMVASARAAAAAVAAMHVFTPPPLALPGARDWTYPGWVDTRFRVQPPPIAASGLRYGPGPASSALPGGVGRAALPPWVDGAVPAAAAGSNLATGAPRPYGYGPWAWGQNWRPPGGSIMPPIPPVGRAFGMGGGGGGGWNYTPGGGPPRPPSYLPPIGDPFGFGRSFGALGGLVGGLTGGPLGHLLEVGTVIDAVHEAVKFQTNLASIGAISNATPQDQARIRQQMFTTGHMAAMSPVEVSGMFREIVRQSAGSIPIATMEQILPQLAKAQTVIGTTRGYSPEQTTDAIMAYVHMMQMYDPKLMQGTQGFDLATRFFELIPNAPSQTIRQLTQFVPVLKQLGATDQDMDSLMVVLARAGFGTGRGGTGLAQIALQSLGPLHIASMSAAMKAGDLENMGLKSQTGLSRFFFDKKNADLFGSDRPGDVGMLGEMAQIVNREGRVRAAQLFSSVFGQAGGRIADLLGNPITQSQLQGVHKELTDPNSTIGLNKQFGIFMGTPGKAIEGAFQDFQGLATAVGTISLPAVTRGFTDLRNTLYSASMWLNSHEKETKNWSNMLVKDLLGVETFFNEHHKDFQSIGNDFAYIGREAVPLAKNLIGAIGPLVRLGRVASDIFSGNWTDLGDIIKEQQKVGEKVIPEQRTLWKDLNVGHYKAPNGPIILRGPMPGGMNLNNHIGIPPHPTTTAKPGTTQTVGKVEININGANKSPHEIGMEVDRFIAQRFGNPRSMQSRSSDSRTHPNIPNSLTVKRGTA